ncbi:hypothetical protein, partial [Rubrivirga sp.]|uniref:hypothetical protein n=1 Tax=Rubrivirga sp. TaxID=1885344 RepID=UPI003C7326F8
VYEFPDGGPIEDGPVPDRILVGGDLRLRVGPLLIAGEAISELVDGPGGFAGNRTGLYGTVGLDVADDHRVLARLDHFDGSNDLLLGYNTSFSQAAAGQLNLGLPLDDDGAPGRTRVLINVQVAF